MRVAVKIVVVMVLILACVRGFEGALTVQRETERLNADIRRDSDLMVSALRELVSEVWRSSGKMRAIERLEQTNVPGHPVQIAWVETGTEGGLRTQLDDEALDRLAAGKVVSMRRTDRTRGEMHYVYMPIDVPEADGAVRLAETLAERSRYVNRAVMREVIAGSCVIGFGSAVIILCGVVVIGRPLTDLRRHVKQIGEGDLSSRLTLRGRDELSALAEGINAMCAKLSASYERERDATEKRIAALEQMRHADRLTTIGRLASGIAHELGTPLNVITARADMIAEGGLPPQRAQDYALTVKGQADRMAEIIRHLLDFARQREPHRVRVQARHIVDQVVDLMASLGYKGRMRVESPEAASPLEAEMDPGQMQQVLINLTENALQAMPDGGEVILAVRSTHADPPTGIVASPGPYLRMDVKDSGAGIAEEHLPELFDPFFTTKDVGQGTGLGLSIAHGIVREHHGWISVSSEVGRGSCFSVYIPQRQEVT